MYPRLKLPKIIGFDIDWTLYFPKKDERIPLKFCELIANELKLNFQTTYQYYLDQKKIFPDAPTIFKKLSNNKLPKKIIHKHIQTAIESFQSIRDVEKNPELTQMFENLYQKYPLYLITGNTEEFAKTKLNAIGLDILLFKEQLYENKYKREDGSAFKFVKQKFEVSYPEMMYIGDRELIDIVPANKLGMQTILVKPEYAKTNATYQVQKIEDISSILL